MSISEWVINQYTKNNTQNLNLESAKNFTFIWCIFEKFSRDNIFSSSTLINNEFINWAKLLKVERSISGIKLINCSQQNQIDMELVNNIHKVCNYFYQLYIKDKSDFVNVLYNQSDERVQREKKQFDRFMSNFKSEFIQDKIIFLYFIAKRMRNKFFHGIKSIDDISKDYKKFDMISEFLIAIISLIENYDSN